MTESDDDERQTFSEGTDSGREEEEDKEKQEIKRGRPVGKADSNQRYRRTAQEISNDKICVAQMKLDALKDKEALKLALRTSKKTVSLSVKRRPSPVSTQRVPSPKRKSKEKVSPQPSKIKDTHTHIDDSGEITPPLPPTTLEGKRRQLYDSWFPSSPRSAWG